MRYLLLICFFLTSCILSTWDSRVVLVNNTSEKIRYIDQLMSKDDLTPDTLNCGQWNFYDVPPKSEQRLHSQVKFDVYFKQHPENFFRIFIINEDSLQKYGACEILRQQMFVKRYDLKYDDLEKLNWRVEYKE